MLLMKHLGPLRKFGWGGVVRKNLCCGELTNWSSQFGYSVLAEAEKSTCLLLLFLLERARVMTMSLSSQPHTAEVHEEVGSAMGGGNAPAEAGSVTYHDDNDRVVLLLSSSSSASSSTPTPGSGPYGAKDTGVVETSRTTVLIDDSERSHSPIARRRHSDSSDVRLVAWKGEGVDDDIFVDEDVVEDTEVLMNAAVVDSERLMVDSALAAYNRQRQQMHHETQHQEHHQCDHHATGRDANDDEETVRNELGRVEARIFKAARLELELLNRSKALRSRREVLTKRYRYLCRVLGKLQQRQQQQEQQQQCDRPNGSSTSGSRRRRREVVAGSFVMARLPPLLPRKVYDLTTTTTTTTPTATTATTTSGSC